jgi:hypothetical protein
MFPRHSAEGRRRAAEASMPHTHPNSDVYKRQKELEKQASRLSADIHFSLSQEEGSRWNRLEDDDAIGEHEVTTLLGQPSETRMKIPLPANSIKVVDEQFGSESESDDSDADFALSYMLSGGSVGMGTEPLSQHKSELLSSSKCSNLNMSTSVKCVSDQSSPIEGKANSNFEVKRCCFDVRSMEGEKHAVAGGSYVSLWKTSTKNQNEKKATYLHKTEVNKSKPRQKK